MTASITKINKDQSRQRDLSTAASSRLTTPVDSKNNSNISTPLVPRERMELHKRFNSEVPSLASSIPVLKSERPYIGIKDLMFSFDLNPHLLSKSNGGQEIREHILLNLDERELGTGERIPSFPPEIIAQSNVNTRKFKWNPFIHLSLPNTPRLLSQDQPTHSTESDKSQTLNMLENEDFMSEIDEEFKSFQTETNSMEEPVNLPNNISEKDSFEMEIDLKPLVEVIDVSEGRSRRRTSSINYAV